MNDPLINDPQINDPQINDPQINDPYLWQKKTEKYSNNFSKRLSPGLQVRYTF